MSSTAAPDLEIDTIGPPTLNFSTVEDLFTAIDSTAGDDLIINKVSLQAFQDICSAREEKNRKFHFSLYTAESGILIITIPTLYHEIAHRQLELYMAEQRATMGLRADWIAAGGSTYEQISSGSLITSGEGDSIGLPPSARSSRDAWPTIVIECSYSQTLASLIAKAHWWFTTSNYEIKIVLLLKVNERKESIHIEKWKAAPSSTRLGATMTRAAAALYPRCFQTIDITRNPDISITHTNRRSLSQYVVHSGPLRLEFADLFLRHPTPGTAEGDMVINDDDLRLLAVNTWRPQV